MFSLEDADVSRGFFTTFFTDCFDVLVFAFFLLVTAFFGFAVDFLLAFDLEPALFAAAPFALPLPFDCLALVFLEPPFGASTRPFEPLLAACSARLSTMNLCFLRLMECQWFFIALSLLPGKNCESSFQLHRQHSEKRCNIFSTMQIELTSCPFHAAV